MNIKTPMILVAVLCIPAVCGASITYIDPPSIELSEGNLESTDAIFAFWEGSYTLSTSLAVDFVPDGTEETFDRWSHPSPGSGSIAAGQQVESWFFHFDPVGRTFGQASGQATFGADILGIILIGDTLNDSDSVFGRTSYGGLEFNTSNPGSDMVTVSADGRQVTFDWLKADVGVDQVRVLVASGSQQPAPVVPEPSPWAIWLVLGGLLMWWTNHNNISLGRQTG